jgi:SsrA-binding protein
MKPLVNKRANFDYEILETYTAGIKLTGHETKSLKTKGGSIRGSHIIIRGDEAFVVGMQIPSFQEKNSPNDYDHQRTRKLLLNKSEISRLAGKASSGLTIIPIKVYDNPHSLLKIEIAVAKGRKKHDKRELIKKRESIREARSVKNAYNGDDRPR